MVQRTPIRTVALIASLSVLAVMAALWKTGCSERRIEMSAEHAIEWVDETVGSGIEVREGMMIRVQYWLQLPDGTKVVDLYKDDRTHPFRVGDGTVIAGLDLAVRGMRQGGVRMVTLPPISHYGRKGYGGVIPEDTTLTMRLEMVDVSF